MRASIAAALSTGRPSARLRVGISCRSDGFSPIIGIGAPICANLPSGWRFPKAEASAAHISGASVRVHPFSIQISTPLSPSLFTSLYSVNHKQSVQK